MLPIASPAGLRHSDVWVPSRRRLLASVVVGGVVAGVSAGIAAWQITVLAAWCSAAVVFMVLAWATMLGADGERTRALARREDESRVAADLIVLAASIASLVGVALILLKAEDSKGGTAAAMTGLGVLSVVLAWALVHTVFTQHYADLYYAEGGGIDFDDEDDPDYRDFAYLAFTIGMTYQVSDTSLQTKALRRTALRHALFSFVFGTAIIAMTINVVAGLSR